ncbi:MAG: tagaturonate epimerase family protein, partial [Planctomycetes bacterium]|nr:tagaturonate epimerase family protein [Planctomycetota bacterium]
MKYKDKELTFDPARNPAVLDTVTWDIDGARERVSRFTTDDLEPVASAALNGKPLPDLDGAILHDASLGRKEAAAAFLVELDDHQQVFVEALPGGATPTLGEPIGQRDLENGITLVCHAGHAATIHRYFREYNPEKGSRALGSTPRLGVGVRMTTACWPAILEAMQKRGFSANIIQNSVRELNRLDPILGAEPAEKNYACGFGTIETGYTGSTYEGLWVSGVLDALKYPAVLPYGADADHVQVKRGAEGLARAKNLLECSRYYSFYTIDMADILKYEAMNESSDAGAAAYLDSEIENASLRKEIMALYRQKRRIGHKEYTFDDATLGRLVGKYWSTLAVMEDLAETIRGLKDGEPFDLEFTMDEHPPEVGAFDCLTSDHETLFVLLELERRAIPVTHIAPNFGVEKGLDYRCPDGLDGLERRVRSQFAIAEEFGVMLDIHSGDDLTSEPRRVFKKATRGKNHNKNSPKPQNILADLLEENDPALFREWWEDAVAYATHEAEAGSEFARECLKELEGRDDKSPSRRHMLFHHYSFRFVGRRDADGRFLHRERFYELSPEFYADYGRRFTDYL